MHSATRAQSRAERSKSHLSALSLPTAITYRCARLFVRVYGLSEREARQNVNFRVLVFDRVCICACAYVRVCELNLSFARSRFNFSFTKSRFFICNGVGTDFCCRSQAIKEGKKVHMRNDRHRILQRFNNYVFTLYSGFCRVSGMTVLVSVCGVLLPVRARTCVCAEFGLLSFPSRPCGKFQ